MCRRGNTECVSRNKGRQRLGRRHPCVREVPALNAFCFLEHHPTVQKPLRDCLAEAEVVEREKFLLRCVQCLGMRRGCGGVGGLRRVTRCPS